MPTVVRLWALPPFPTRSGFFSEGHVPPSRRGLPLHKFAQVNLKRYPGTRVLARGSQRFQAVSAWLRDRRSAPPLPELLFCDRTNGNLGLNFIGGAR